MKWAAASATRSPSTGQMDPFGATSVPGGRPLRIRSPTIGEKVRALKVEIRIANATVSANWRQMMPVKPG